MRVIIEHRSSHLISYVIRPRVILVEKVGTLVGLITVKDVLRFIEREEADGSGSRHGRTLNSSNFDGTLEEAWVWITQRIRLWLPR